MIFSFYRILAITVISASMLSYSDASSEDAVNESKTVAENSNSYAKTENTKTNSDIVIDKLPNDDTGDKNSNKADEQSVITTNESSNINTNDTINNLPDVYERTKSENDYIKKYWLYAKIGPSLELININNIIADKTFKNRTKMSLRLAIGASYNIGDSRMFFISTELFALSMSKPIQAQATRYLTDDESFFYKTKKEYEIIKSNFFGAVGASPRFGVNLFNGRASLYIKANVGISFFTNGTQEFEIDNIKTPLERKERFSMPLLPSIKFFEIVTNNVDFENTEMHYNITYGAGLGIDINLTKHFFVFAELNYLYLPYKVSWMNNGQEKTITSNFNITSFSVGLGLMF